MAIHVHVYGMKVYIMAMKNNNIYDGSENKQYI